MLNPMPLHPDSARGRISAGPGRCVLSCLISRRGPPFPFFRIGGRGAIVPGAVPPRTRRRLHQRPHGRALIRLSMIYRAGALAISLRLADCLLNFFLFFFFFFSSPLPLPVGGKHTSPGKVCPWLTRIFSTSLTFVPGPNAFRSLAPRPVRLLIP